MAIHLSKRLYTHTSSIIKVVEALSMPNYCHYARVLITYPFLVMSAVDGPNPDSSPVEMLRRHAVMYHQELPLFIHLDRPPCWRCMYMGNETGADGDPTTEGQQTVARLMLLLVTVNRPLPGFTP